MKPPRPTSQIPLQVLALCSWLGCGGRAPAPRPVQVVAPAPEVSPAPRPPPDEPAPRPLLTIDWAQVHLQTDEDARALWKQIAPTGADWTLRLGELPNDDALLKPLAIALLREGNFQCPARLPCTDAGVQDVAAEATLDDPCLRRELALWAFARLDEEDAAALADPLVAIAGLPPPEHELVAEAFDLVPAEQDALLLRMNAAARAVGQGELADLSLQWISPAGLREVVARMHSDGVYALLDVTGDRAAFVAAIGDGQLAPQTRITAMRELGDGQPLAKDLRLALRKAAADPRCEVAAAAARLLEEHGDRSALPRPARASTAAAVRALCVAAAYSQEQAGVDEILRPFISRQGLQVIDHAALEQTPDDVQGELIPRAELITLPFLEELGEALEHCAGTTCKAQSQRFELTFDAERLLHRVERFADDPAGCAAASGS